MEWSESGQKADRLGATLDCSARIVTAALFADELFSGLGAPGSRERYSWSLKLHENDVIETQFLKCLLVALLLIREIKILIEEYLTKTSF